MIRAGSSMLFMVKFFPEMMVKSKTVRKQMMKRLQNNLANAMRSISPNIKIKLEWDKLTVDVFDEDPQVSVDAAESLRNTSGIAYFLEVDTMSFDSLDDICEKVFAVYAPRIKDKRFVVRCKRSGTHDFTSHEAERYVGGYLYQRGESLGVELRSPDIKVLFEIHQDTLHIVKRRIAGLGGYPLGEVAPVLSLISGGFDSPVASYLTMKRGMPTHFCFFNLGGRDHELGVKEVSYYLWQKFGSSRRVKFISVPFESVVAEILEKVDDPQMGVILKRMMLRVATRLAEKLEIEALVTGEAVSQVSSQTLRNLSVIDKVTDMLVLRPLATADKGEIIDISRRIGTEEFAANMPEYCGVISVKPTTKARMHRVERDESRFDFAVLDAAFDDAQLINIDQLADQDFSRVAVESFAVPLPNSQIIDIRHRDEVDKKPLIIAGQKILNMPFYSLHKQFSELEKNKKYLLYCDKGVMSKLHAAYLFEDGFDVGVYRPTH